MRDRYPPRARCLPVDHAPAAMPVETAALRPRTIPTVTRDMADSSDRDKDAGRAAPGQADSRSQQDELRARIEQYRRYLEDSGEESDSEVVLSSEDSRQMPASLVVGEDDVREKVEEPTGGGKQDRPPRRRRLGSWQLPEKLAAALRVPEKTLGRGWRGSGTRAWLRERFEWMRDMQDARELAIQLEETYGGPARIRYRIRRFVRNNVLLSVLAGILVIYVGRAGATWFLDTRLADTTGELITARDVRYQFESADGDGTGRPPSVSGALIPKSPARLQLEQTLQHCTVPRVTRVTLLNQLGTAERFEEGAYAQAMSEIRHFQSVYREAGLLDYVRGNAARHELMVERVRPILPVLEERAARVRGQIGERRERLEEMQRRLDALQDPDRLGQVEDINASIRLRNAMEQLRGELADGPAARDMQRLESELQRIRLHVAGGAPEAGGAGAAPTGTDSWAGRVRDMPQDALDAEVQRFIAEELLANADAMIDAPPAVQRYRLQIVGAEVRQLADAMSALQRRPDHLLIRLDRERAAANRQLDALLGEPPPPAEEGAPAPEHWVDHVPCLAELNPEAPRGG